MYGDFLRTFGGLEGSRAYRLHVPYLYNPESPAPLVLNYHGFGQSAAGQEAYSGLLPISDREGFLLAAPEGAGYPPGWDIPGVYNEDGFDDVNATVLMVAHIKAEFCVDPDRVFATGMSNGAEMAALVVCRYPDIFAASAPVAGVVYEGCAAPGAAIIAFHGTADYNVPFEIAPPAMREWARRNGCDAGEQVEGYSAHVSVATFGDCQGRDVVFYVIEGGGHAWPGAAEGLPGGADPPNQEIQAAELIWAFFAAHPRLSAPGAGPPDGPAQPAPDPGTTAGD